MFMKLTKLLLVLCLLAAMLAGGLYYFRPMPDPVTVSLPQGITQSREKGHTVFQKDGKTIGGIVCFAIPEEAWGWDPVQYSNELMPILKQAGAYPVGEADFDYMHDSGLYSASQIWLGKPGQEYEHYLFFSGRQGADLWFDRNETEEAPMQAILRSFAWNG